MSQQKTPGEIILQINTAVGAVKSCSGQLPATVAITLTQALKFLDEAHWLTEQWQENEAEKLRIKANGRG